ncbi:MAG: HAMP domain-containing protein [Ignavibacteriales bacterium]|nr:HAMP domain-containing protein [Ignavibacteriales bacterium]
MAILRNLFTGSLRNRLLISTVALVILIAGSVLMIVDYEIRDLTNTKLQKDFDITYHTFKRFLSLRNETLVKSCLLISELPVLKAQLSTRDPATIKDYILSREESPARLVGVDLFTLTDEKGRVLFRLDRPEKFGDTLAFMPVIRHALEGKDPTPDDISFLIIDEQMYQTVTVPIFQKFVIGTLTLGKRITQEEAKALKSDTHSDITFLRGNRIVASTNSDLAQIDLLRSYMVDMTELDRQISEGKSVQRETILDGENFLCAFVRASNTSDAIYVMAISVDQSLAELRKIEKIILMIGGLSLILAILGAFILAEGITSPLRKLVVGTEQIRAGNYDFHLQIDSKDEIGKLAQSFDEMVLGLKERFMMSKFLSSSTMEMIRKEGDKLHLGGERRNVTVLFSDIRGFTAFSEKVEPEVVIELLSRYLSRQASIVISHNGIIDKYVGDELIAIFEGSEMVDDAVLCAIEIQCAINELNSKNTEDIRVGIGINTGMAIVGNVGGEERMDHTVLGNNMNLGSRLCSIALSGQIIISESSWRSLKSKEVKTRSLEAIVVKGISTPVQTYEVLYHAA